MAPPTTDGAPTEEDYDVFLARIEDIGYDATGRLTVAETEAAMPPDVAATISDFDRLVGWR
jgi:type I restriction enzyme M protein